MSDRDRTGTNGRGRADSPRDAGRAWTPAVAFALVVFLASVVPIPGSGGGSPTDAVDGGGGWVAAVGITDPFHLVGYAVLAVLVSRATGRGSGGLLAAAAIATAFGFGIELVQAPIPWRGFAWRDVLLNAAGASLGVVGIRIVGGRVPGTGSD